MNGLVFDVLFVVGVLTSLSCLSLLALAVCFSLADWRRSRLQNRQMERLRDAAFGEWADAEANDDALCRTLEEIQALPIARGA
jgi:hypothetical protein